MEDFEILLYELINKLCIIAILKNTIFSTIYDNSDRNVSVKYIERWSSRKSSQTLCNVIANMNF